MEWNEGPQAAAWQALGAALVLAVPFTGEADYKLQYYWACSKFFCAGGLAGAPGARGGEEQGAATAGYGRGGRSFQWD